MLNQCSCYASRAHGLSISPQYNCPCECHHGDAAKQYDSSQIQEKFSTSVSESTLELKHQISELQAGQRNILTMTADMVKDVRDKLHVAEKRIEALDKQVASHESDHESVSKTLCRHNEIFDKQYERLEALEAKELMLHNDMVDNILNRLCELENPEWHQRPNELLKRIEKLEQGHLCDGHHERNAYCVDCYEGKKKDLSFTEALQAMKHGKMLKRQAWDKFSIGVDFDAILDYDDVTAMDWCIVD